MADSAGTAVTTDTGPLTLDEAIGALTAAPEPEDEQEEAPVAERAPPANLPADEEDAAIDGEAEEEIEAEADDDETDEEDEGERLPPPASWATEDHPAWDALPAKTQAVVAKREADRDRAVSQAVSKVGGLAADISKMRGDYETLAANFQSEADRSAGIWQQRWGNVDWARYAREDQANYIADRALAEQEWSDVQATNAQAEKARGIAAKTEADNLQAHIIAEGEKLKTVAPDLVDEKTGAARYKVVFEHLRDEAKMDLSAIKWATADELSYVNDALKWRAAQAEAKRQSTLPRRPTTPPRAIAPQGQAGAIPNARRQTAALSANLTKTGSVDDAVALLVARSSQKAKKK